MSFLLSLLASTVLSQDVVARRLEANVRFLASDALEGRGTPGRGLDLAAEYIASELREAGADPVDGSYFLTYPYTDRRSGQESSVRNVIGLIPGSDPKLKDTYVVVSAHYDHLGVRQGEGDQIFNGANDDASGVAGVLEVARTLSALPKKPKRTVVFLFFWGEERGLLGSRAYCTAPKLPLKNTIAMVNLEQIGRTDDTEGPRVGEFNITGFDFSSLSQELKAAAAKEGVKVTKHERLSDVYFAASDNQAFANAGVPAHTVSTSYQFPDYHRAGDHWEKLDYPNFARIVRAVGAGVKRVADSAAPVVWNKGNPKTERYRTAYEKLMSGG